MSQQRKNSVKWTKHIRKTNIYTQKSELVQTFEDITSLRPWILFIWNEKKGAYCILWCLSIEKCIRIQMTHKYKFVKQFRIRAHRKKNQQWKESMFVGNQKKFAHFFNTFSANSSERGKYDWWTYWLKWKKKH